MTDRELLEAAAKAAGVELLWTFGGQPVNVPTLFKGMGSDEVWNPLDDDGDALRLAVKLKMRVGVAQVDWVGAEYIGCFEESGSNPYAATRRAIVRAAAATVTQPKS